VRTKSNERTTKRTTKRTKNAFGGLAPSAPFKLEHCQTVRSFVRSCNHSILRWRLVNAFGWGDDCRCCVVWRGVACWLWLLIQMPTQPPTSLLCRASLCVGVGCAIVHVLPNSKPSTNRIRDCMKVSVAEDHIHFRWSLVGLQLANFYMSGFGGGNGGDGGR